MFLKTFTTTMKRIFRSPAMLFSIPAILIMLQQRTRLLPKALLPIISLFKAAISIRSILRHRGTTYITRCCLMPF